jgi:predicted flap endonuclease-1-like 5' DNA nuclease
MGPAIREKLLEIGIRTTGELIQVCSTLHGRTELSAAAGIDLDRLMEWVHVADLMRIHGIGRQYAELLGASGVRTMAALRRQQPDELARKIREVNGTKGLAKTTPSPKTIERWVDDARDLPSRVAR